MGIIVLMGHKVALKMHVLLALLEKKQEANLRQIAENVLLVIIVVALVLKRFQVHVHQVIFVERLQTVVD